MIVFECLIVAVLTAICSIILKKRNAEMSLLVAIAGAIIILISGISYISSAINEIKSLNLLKEDFFVIPLKILGLTLLSSITSSICEDSGEKGLSTAVQTITKFASITIAFPLFEKLLELIKVTLEI